MARKADAGRLGRIRDAIIEHSEQKAGGYASLLGYHNKRVVPALQQVEERGDLLVEDDSGRLTWFNYFWQTDANRQSCVNRRLPANRNWLYLRQLRLLIDRKRRKDALVLGDSLCLCFFAPLRAISSNKKEKRAQLP